MDLPRSSDNAAESRKIPKTPSGIEGFDEISGGGFPAGRTTVIVGGPGSGKTVFSLQTLVNGVRQRQEPAIFVSFEEAPERIIDNAAGFDWEITSLSEHQLSFIDARLPPDMIHEGGFDLHGLLTAIEAQAKAIDARHIVIDGIDAVLSLLADSIKERHEIDRLRYWMERIELTCLVTCKTATDEIRSRQRYDHLHYLADCVVLLENGVHRNVHYGNLRIIKYRGSGFAANTFPAAITAHGLEVVLTEGIQASYPVFNERISSGISRLDALCGGGYIRGTSILLSGEPGTAKTTLCASLANAACEQKETALFICFDDSGNRLVDNMRSVGIELASHISAERLHISVLSAVNRSPQALYVEIRSLIAKHRPQVLILDPISTLADERYLFGHAISEGLIRLGKIHGITVMCTSLMENIDQGAEYTASQISTIADTWIHLSYHPIGGERNRALTIVKSRGTDHSNQVRELLLSEQGIDLAEVYTARGEILLGSARVQREMEDRRRELEEQNEFRRREFELKKQKEETSHRLKALQRELELYEQELHHLEATEQARIEYERFSEQERTRLRRPDR